MPHLRALRMTLVLKYLEFGIKTPMVYLVAGIRMELAFGVLKKF